ncbi:MAG: hypothetical protein ACXVB6_20580 [Mucilaginibacter sp.]
MFVFYGVTAMSQVKHKALSDKPVVKSDKSVVKKVESAQLKDFYHLTTEANVVFTFPWGFKESQAMHKEDFPFDYAIEIPGHEFEIWFQVRSQKQNWVDYERFKNDPSKQIAYPDSLYISMGQAQTIALTGDQKYYTRNIAPDVLDRYHANAGKSYLINLLDLPETKRYKYALLLTLQKDHIGTIMAVCFTNEKSSEFFKNVSRISRYIKFKP